MPQVWLFFVPGAGGDGIANLFEHCHGVRKIDDLAPNDQNACWRIHRIVDNQIKFWAPTVDTEFCFRKNVRNPFKLGTNSLAPIYESAVNLGETVIVTSHDIDLIGLETSDRQDLFCKDQIKVLLDCRDHHRCYVNRKKKNLQEFPSSHLWDKTLSEVDGFPIYPTIDHSKFDCVLWVEDIQQDFNFTRNFLQQIGLELDRTHYDYYQSLISGEIGWLTTQALRYNSYIDECMVRYYQTDTV